MRSWVARQDKIPRGRTIPTGLSLSRLVGFGTRFPPTHVGARDHRPTPSRLRALYFLRPFFGSATNLDLEQGRSEGAPAPRRSRPARQNRARRSRRFQPSSGRRRFCASRVSGVPGASRSFTPCAMSRTRSCLWLALADEGFATALPVRRWPGIGARFSPLAAWGSLRAQARCPFASLSRTRPSSSPISYSCRLPVSTGAATASAMAAAITTGP